MSEHDEIPEDVAYAEFTFADGVTHRVPLTPGGGVAAQCDWGVRHHRMHETSAAADH